MILSAIPYNFGYNYDISHPPLWILGIRNSRMMLALSTNAIQYNKINILIFNRTLDSIVCQCIVLIKKNFHANSLKGTVNVV